MSGEEHATVTDRVALMQGTGRRGARHVARPILALGAIALTLAAGIGVFALWPEAAPARRAAGGDLIPPPTTSTDQPRGRGLLIGDVGTDFDVPRDPEIAVLKAQIRDLEAKLDAPGAMTAETRAGIDALEAKLEEMRAGHETQLSEYRDYIARLEARIGRLQPRPVSLDESKWVRAQHLNVEDSIEDAARLAAPALVFDDSEERAQEDLQQEIEARYRQRAPEDVPVRWQRGAPDAGPLVIERRRRAP